VIRNCKQHALHKGGALKITGAEMTPIDTEITMMTWSFSATVLSTFGHFDNQWERRNGLGG
jgi:hypothetical protein